ncbi:hypothetical protein [Aestuariibius sp. HNIBRBA575]|uniref:lipase family protein n=1 Tax=Aestuariibius sp. HNIBRBA575 TaxID=3233343 RepID=UPI0034A0E512
MSVIGYYSMDASQGEAFQIDEIMDNGHTAQSVTSLTAAELSQIDILYVVNSNNGSFGSEYLTNLANIQAAVNAGMSLVIFDRHVTDAQTILPGGDTVTFVRETGTEIDIAAGAPSDFVNGSAGTITDVDYDDANFSVHGYANLADLPVGATPLLTTGSATEIAAFSYQYGAGTVFYSSIPLDFYSDRSLPTITPDEVTRLAGNVFEHVTGGGAPQFTSTADVFDEFGQMGLFSNLSLAAYELQPHETTGTFNAQATPATDRLDGMLYFLQTSDLPSLSPVATGDPEYPQDGLVDGFYTSGNAAALVARSDDAMFVSFRGTNSAGDAAPDWLAQYNHLQDLTELMDAIRDYLTVNPEITQVYLTGHSLGSSMADYWTSILNNWGLSASIENISFAAPGVFTNLPEFDNAASFRMDGDVIGIPAFFSDNFGDLNEFHNNLLSQIGPVDTHSMHVYNQYVEFAQSQGITLTNMTELFHGVDYDVLIAHSQIANEAALNLNVGAGVDYIYGGGGHEIILGGAGFDGLFGNGGVDHLDGGTGNDLIYGGSGGDHMYGDIGLDTMRGGTGHDVIEGEGGSDTIWGQNGNDTLNGGGGHDELFGGANADELYGGAGSDTLQGGAQADLLDGGAGADTLQGGTGRDTLTGGTGNDVFVFNSIGETNSIARNDGHALTWSADVITDFNAAQDVIDLSGIDGQRFRAEDAFHFSGEADLIVFERGQLSYYHSGSNTIVHGSNDGDIYSDFAIVLLGTHDLTADNFYL